MSSKAPNHKHQAPNKFEFTKSNDGNGESSAVLNIASFRHLNLFVIWCLVIGHSVALAADGFPRVQPTPPDRAESTFEVQHGFRMELIAAEPLVVDPVDLA